MTSHATFSWLALSLFVLTMHFLEGAEGYGSGAASGYFAKEQEAKYSQQSYVNGELQHHEQGAEYYSKHGELGAATTRAPVENHFMYHDEYSKDGAGAKVHGTGVGQKMSLSSGQHHHHGHRAQRLNGATLASGMSGGDMSVVAGSVGVGGAGGVTGGFETKSGSSMSSYEHHHRSSYAGASASSSKAEGCCGGAVVASIPFAVGGAEVGGHGGSAGGYQGHPHRPSDTEPLSPLTMGTSGQHQHQQQQQQQTVKVPYIFTTAGAERAMSASAQQSQTWRQQQHPHRKDSLSPSVGDDAAKRWYERAHAEKSVAPSVGKVSVGGLHDVETLALGGAAGVEGFEFGSSGGRKPMFGSGDLRDVKELSRNEYEMCKGQSREHMEKMLKQIERNLAQCNNRRLVV